MWTPSTHMGDLDRVQVPGFGPALAAEPFWGVKQVCFSLSLSLSHSAFKYFFFKKSA